MLSGHAAVDTSNSMTLPDTLGEHAADTLGRCAFDAFLAHRGQAAVVDDYLRRRGLHEGDTPLSDEPMRGERDRTP